MGFAIQSRSGGRAETGIHNLDLRDFAATHDSGRFIEVIGPNNNRYRRYFTSVLKLLWLKGRQRISLQTCS